MINLNLKFCARTKYIFALQYCNNVFFLTNLTRTFLCLKLQKTQPLTLALSFDLLFGFYNSFLMFAEVFLSTVKISINKMYYRYC